MGECRRGVLGSGLGGMRRCRANRLWVGGGWRLGGCCLGGVGGWWLCWDLDGRVTGGRAGGA